MNSHDHDGNNAATTGDDDENDGDENDCDAEDDIDLESKDGESKDDDGGESGGDDDGIGLVSHANLDGGQTGKMVTKTKGHPCLI